MAVSAHRQVLSIADLTEASGAKRSTLRDWLNRWERARWIARKRMGNDGTQVIVLDPEGPFRRIPALLPPPSQGEGGLISVPLPSRPPRNPPIRRRPPAPLERKAERPPSSASALPREKNTTRPPSGENQANASSARQQGRTAARRPSLTEQEGTSLVRRADDPPTGSADRCSALLKNDPPSSIRPPDSRADLERTDEASAPLAITDPPVQNAYTPSASQGGASPPSRQARRLNFQFARLGAHEWRISERLIAIGLVVVALAIVRESLEINRWFAEWLAGSERAKVLWKDAAWFVGIAGVLMPMALRVLGDHEWQLRAICRCMLSIAIALGVSAAVGFASVNVADKTAARGADADRRRELDESLRRARVEIDGTKARTVVAIEAALQAVPALIAPNIWRLSAGCTDITLPSSAAACAPALRLREEHATARRRFELERRIDEMELEKRKLPAIVSADPHAQMAAGILNWLTWQTAGFTQDDIRYVRVLLLVLAVEFLPPVLIAMASAIWFRRRTQGPAQ